MISIQKEEMIRHLLDDGLTIRDVANRTEASRSTVQKIKKATGLRERKPLQIKPETPPSTKWLRRTRRCRTCGALLKIWPCVLCHPISGDVRKEELNLKKIAEATAAESLELFRIVRDLQELSRLRRITDPLFINLASRATASLERIFPQTKEKNATEKNTTTE